MSDELDYAEQYENIDMNYAMINAAFLGRMDIVQLMISKGATSFNWAMATAARYGHMNIVQFMISKGATSFDIAIDEVVYNNQYYLGCPLSIIAEFLKNLSRDEVKLTKYRQALVKYFQVINNREQILTLLLINRDITYGTGIPSRICEFF
jgi:ankyrin repeat protein